MKISILESLGLEKNILEKIVLPLKERGHQVAIWESLPENSEDLVARAEGAEALIIANMPFPDDVIRRLPTLKMLSVAFTGVDHVGLQACRERKIEVCNAAGYATEATAEMALLLMLGALRFAGDCHGAVRSGGTRQGLLGSELMGKTVGILGTGAIGLRLGELLLSFGCNLLGYSRTEHSHALELGIHYVPLEKLLKESDVISVHLPLTPGTRGLLGEKEIASMKPGAVLVNAARGPVVDSQALAKALEEGHLGAAGIDVFETEPPIEANHPLLQAPRIFLAPHVGFFTREALAARARMVVENILDWEDGFCRNSVL
ncbi:MAG TPA: NAD(P)-dependent oxidoreductase [Synergistaceae bacterium]|nr:NAD(P)-dependent oxidoreductase [Synergistaceae bacterium]HPJ26399.1 NAD(P)-dependent oxidoreductase [Synergistaceae bacterium]HPQ37151.1 NAD(P)-dependent oxidoreductase [Synergistaceae bacterium]